MEIDWNRIGKHASEQKHDRNPDAIENKASIIYGNGIFRFLFTLIRNGYVLERDAQNEL